MFLLSTLTACADRLPTEPAAAPNISADLVAADGTWLLLTETSLDLGPVFVGATSSAQRAFLTNVGTVPITLSMAGGAPTNTAFLAVQSCNEATLTPGASCYLEFTFSPAATGTVQSSSIFQVNGQSFSVSLRGTGLDHSFRVTPGALNFGELVVGTTSATRVVDVTNMGAAPVIVAVAGGAPFINDFLVTLNCNEVTLQPGASCQLFVVFTPTSTGLRESASMLTLNGVPFRVELTGVGIASEAQRTGTFTVESSILDFGDVQVGTVAQTQFVNIRNVSATTVFVGMAGGAVLPPFTVLSGCNEVSLAPGAACTLDVMFEPTAEGPTSATSVFTLNGQQHSVTMAGVGVPPRFRVSPNGLDFGAVPVGQQSADLYTYITNVGPSPVTVKMAGGAPLQPFMTLTGCSEVTLAPGQSCHLIHSFTPTAGGVATGASVFTLNGQQYSVQLRGTGESAATVSVLFLRPVGQTDFSAIAGSTVPIKFALVQQDGTRLSDDDAVALATACGVTVTFSGAAGVRCATYDAKEDHFHVNLRLDRSLAPGAWNVVVSVVSGGATVGTGSTGIRVRSPGS